ncbi:MAG: VWA domain-containing protein [Holophagales bacterium]|nr:VWA domain-containing protein [Holophagales bacterium]
MTAAVSTPRMAAASTTVLAAVLAAFLAAPPAALAQSEEEQPLDVEGLFEVVDVEIVNIDVWVTDRAGESVEGLTRDDFLVLRDGDPVPITNFYAVAGGRPVATRAAPSAEDGAAEKDAEPAPPELLLPELLPEHRLWLIVFFDNFNLDPIERNRVLPAVRRFLGQTLRTGDRAMLVTYDRKLEVRHPFTEELPRLYGPLEELKNESGLAVLRHRDRLEALQLIDRSESSREALLVARSYAEEQMNSVGHTVDAIERLLESLGGLPGRKALVHVSSGIPRLAGEELFQAVGVKWNTSEAYAEIPRHDTTREFERAMRQANAQRVVFYTLDAGGLRGFEFGAAEYGGFVSPKLRSTLDSVVPENLQSSLRLMAEETGGRAIVNRNEVFPALEEAARDFRSFYSLGISSGSTHPGRYHRIEVKLRPERKGIELRHRAGYRSKNQQMRMQDALRSALLYAHEANPLAVEVRWARPERQAESRGRESWLLPIQLRIPLEQLVLLPLGDKHELRLELYVGAAGDQGEISEIDRVPLGLRVAEEHLAAARQESFVYTHKLLISGGRKKVGLAILDVFGRQSSIVTRYLEIGPDAGP